MTTMNFPTEIVEFVLRPDDSYSWQVTGGDNVHVIELALT